MKKLSYIKVLERPTWIRLIELKAKMYPTFDPEKEMVDMGYNEITPILNRDGHYYHRTIKCVWIEYDGRAWIKDNQESEIIQFRLDLESLELEEDRPNKDIIEAMLNLFGKSKKSSRQYRDYKNMKKDLREYKFLESCRLDGLRSKKRLIEFKKKRGL